MSLRLFIAITVPPEVKAALSKARDELASQLSKARISWTRPESMHLTLRFLGDVSPPDVEPVCEALTEATRNFGQIELICERFGCFPGLRSPRIVWAWVHDAADRLLVLNQRITSSTLKFTPEPVEARFTGHVTLARVRQKLGLLEARKIADFLNGPALRAFGSWTATSIELMQSELAPGGSRYTVVRRFSLQSL